MGYEQHPVSRQRQLRLQAVPLPPFAWLPNALCALAELQGSLLARLLPALSELLLPFLRAPSLPPAWQVAPSRPFLWLNGLALPSLLSPSPIAPSPPSPSPGDLPAPFVRVPLPRVLWLPSPFELCPAARSAYAEPPPLAPSPLVDASFARPRALQLLPLKPS